MLSADSSRHPSLSRRRNFWNCRRGHRAASPRRSAGTRGDWDGQYCHASVTSERNAVRDIKVRCPRAHRQLNRGFRDPRLLRTLVSNWRNANRTWSQTATRGKLRNLPARQTCERGVHEDYHATDPSQHAYRTSRSTWRAGATEAVGCDNVKPSDRDTTLPSRSSRPSQSGSPHRSGTPFVIDPGSGQGLFGVQGGTDARQLISTSRYPVRPRRAHQLHHGTMQWYMDGGTVKPTSRSRHWVPCCASVVCPY